MNEVPLPRDAKGHEIPLDTRRLYDKDGERKTVFRFVYSPILKHWTVMLDEGPDGVTDETAVSHFYLNQPDSWEKLEEDLGRGADALDYEACAYFGKSACDCSSCIADKGETCESVVMRDIADRIRALLGGEQDA